MKPLRTSNVIPEDKREDFVTQVFWNINEIYSVSSKFAEHLTLRQKRSEIVDKIGDLFLDAVPHFGPFVKYGSHQLYGKYEFEKEKSANPAFSKFVDVSVWLWDPNHLFENVIIGNGKIARVSKVGVEWVLDETNHSLGEVSPAS
jgi:hypothetical protein